VHTPRVTETLNSFAAGKLAQLEAKSLKRTLVPTHRLDGLWVERGGRRLLSFSCNDYLGLSHHPKVKAAAKDAVDLYGAGSGASRLITGDTPLFSELERRLAAFKGTEAACIFGSGYLANAGIIPTLIGPNDVIFVDALAHSCIWAGAKLSGAVTVEFAHNDVADLKAKLEARRGEGAHAIVATDGVFSMDGDVAPLDGISDACKAHDAWLMVDDAHGLGVVAGGKGSAALFPTAQVPLQMGTFSKAIGGYGAYLCASQPVIDFIKTRARTVVYSTGLPPANIAAALAALDIIEHDAERVARPLAKARRFTRALNMAEAESCIVPIVIGEAETTLAAARALEAQGFLAVPIRPPTVPYGTARLRIAFTADHPDEEVDRLAASVRRILAAA
jgi:8-amino-7-oxononanoate synthase